VGARLRLSDAGYLRRKHPLALGAHVPDPELSPFTAEQVQFAARAWTMKAEEEHHSAAIFADLLSLFVDTGIPLDLLGCIARVVEDELRHTELCLDLARRFRTEPPRARPLPRASHPTTPSERRARGVSIVLVEGAIGETISSALFNVGRHVANEPCSKAALGLILRDEVLHARLFWEALAVLRAEMTSEDLDALQREASRAFGIIENSSILPILQRLERGEPFDPAWAALGVLPPEERVEAFYGAIEKRVRPRLDRLGLDADAAWRDRYKSVSA
jgi:hypothetical protein